MKNHPSISKVLLTAILLGAAFLAGPRLVAQDLRLKDTFKGGHDKRFANCRFVAFSPDGRTLVSVDSVGGVNLWDIATREKKQWFNKAIDGRFEPVWQPALSPDGKLLATTVVSGKDEDMGALVFDLTTGTKKLRIGPVEKQNSVWPVTVVFSPDGKTVATGNNQGAIFLLDLSTKKEIELLKGDVPGSPWIRSIAFSADGKYLAAAIDGTDFRQSVVSVWDVAKKQKIATWNGQKEVTSCIAFTKDGTTVATGSYDHTVKLWDAATGKEKLTLKLDGLVHSMTLSPDGKLLAVGSSGGGTVTLFNVSNGEKKTSISAHSHGVTSVAFSPDGKLLGSTSHDRTVKLWELSSAKDKDK